MQPERIKKYSALVRVCQKLEGGEKTQSLSGGVIVKNAMQLKSIIKNLANEKHISAQLVMQNFMLERLAD